MGDPGLLLTFLAALTFCPGSAPGQVRSHLQADEFVYVCQDAGAGGYEAFPDVRLLRDGRLMAVFYAGYGHVSLPNERLPGGGRICYCLSEKEGQNTERKRPGR